MGFLDDLGLNEFLDDVRAAGEELAALKDDVVSSVVEFGHELADEVAPEPDTRDETDQT